jgi:hypothetical protein
MSVLKRLAVKVARTLEDTSKVSLLRIRRLTDLGLALGSKRTPADDGRQFSLE